MNLFETHDDLLPFIFRIVDNGGESADRFTVITCDGDYFAMSGAPFHPQGVGMTGEGIDVQGVAERVEAGVERDLRWIDLPADCQRCVFDGLNMGFADWLGEFEPPTSRKDAVDYGTAYNLTERIGEGVYGQPGAYFVRREAYPNRDDPSDDLGPYATIRKAVLATLPDECDLSGPEYHGLRDIAGTEGGPEPLWDRDSEPYLLRRDRMDDAFFPDYESAHAAASKSAVPFEIINLDAVEE